MDLFGEEPAAEPTVEEDFTAPEEVLEEGLTEPRAMRFCISHEGNEQLLLDQFSAGRMPHGLVFCGPKGIGKATMAYRLARFLLAQEASDPNQSAMFSEEAKTSSDTLDIPPESNTFRQVASGGHPDLLTIERAYDATKNKHKDSVAVADIRKVNPFLRMTASRAGGWRVVIIDDADTMNRNAQNALLKILEEPPENTAIILITHRMGAMIPTIRSRVRVLNFNALNKEAFNDLLQQQGYILPEEQLDTIYHLSEGSLGVALEYIENSGLDTLTQLLGLFEHYPQWAWPEIHQLADQLARNGQDQAYKNFSELMPWMFSQMITAKARGREIASQALHLNSIQTLHRQSSLESLLKICENLQSHFACVERANLDKRRLARYRIGRGPAFQ